MHISKLEVNKRNEKEKETQTLKSYSNPLFIEGNKIGTAVRGTPKHEKELKELILQAIILGRDPATVGGPKSQRGSRHSQYSV